MNLTSLYTYIIMYFFIAKLHKEKNYTHIFNIIYVLFIFLVNQYNTTFNNVSNYYQIISYLNSKNNIIIIIMCLVLSLYIGFKKNYTMIILLFVFYEYNHLNNYTSSLFILWKGYENLLNTNLINGIMLIHPILLYLYYILVFYYIVIINNGLNIKTTKNNKTFYKKNFLYSICYLILFSILLGCWWAEQELSWGGWWSWDFVELIALNYFILKLFYVHKKENKSVILNFKQIVFFLSTLAVFIIFVRFNLINSIHNFISSSNSNQYYIYILVFMLLLLMFVLNINFNINKSNSYFKYSYDFLIILFYLVFIIIILINIYLKSVINIKFIYISMVFFILIFFLKKNNFINHIQLGQWCVIIIISTILNMIDLIILTCMFVIFVFLKTNLLGVFKKKNFHLLLFLLFLTSLNQIYSFSKEIYYFKNNNIVGLYKNTQIYIDYIFFKPDINYTCVNFFKPNIFILKDIYQNNTLTIDELNKSIFEKKLYFEKNFLFELYNYNFQFFLNINIFVLLLLFLLLLFLLLLFLLLKKTNIKI